MLKLRYANYPKDYFMGILPNSQYGSVAVLPPLNSAHESTSIALGSDYRLGQYAAVTNPNGGSSLAASPSNSTEPKIPFPSAIFTIASFPEKLMSPVKFPYRLAVPSPPNTIFEFVIPDTVLKFPAPVVS